MPFLQGLGVKETTNFLFIRVSRNELKLAEVFIMDENTNIVNENVEDTTKEV